MSNTRKKKWSKILYEDSGFPDNYIDKESFLEFKQINVNARKYSLWDGVIHSGIIMHQVSSVVLFAIIYYCLKFHLIDGYWLLFTCISPLIMIVYLWKRISDKEINLLTFRNDMINLIKFASFSYGLSPILSSLTSTISSDTIYVISAFMLLINLIFHDYGASNNTVVSKTLSFNAALFSSVCLASRSSQITFVLIAIAFILFILWPNYRKYLQERYKHSILILTIISFTATLLSLILLNFWSYACLYLILFLIITFGCPLCLITLQPYKSTINGPWDEALIKM